MFVVKTFVNKRQIREIRVWNTGKRTIVGDYYYEVKEPKLAQTQIVHDRDAGDLVLAVKALRLVKEQEREFPPEEEE